MSAAVSSATASWAASGIPLLTGRPDGPPLVPPGDAAGHAARMSHKFGGTDAAALLAERAAITGRGRAGAMSVGGATRLLPASDGTVAVSCARPDDPSLLSALIGETVTDTDPWTATGAWVATHTCAEFDSRAALLGLAGSSIDRDVTPRPDLLDVAERRAARDIRGMVVVDFSALWAGPLCAQLLGARGARIIKVETPSRLDGSRRTPVFYDLMHSGHESVVLDPDIPAQRAALIALTHRADIVIEASRPRALRGFGIHAEEAVSAGTTWVCITADGRVGDRVGFGDDIAAGAGLITTDGTGGACFVGDAIADPLSGVVAAALVLSEPRGNAGTLWDVSMSGVVAAATAPGGQTPAATQDSAGTWWVDDGTLAHRLETPRARTPAAAAAAPGRDTASALRSLGISSL